jgi:transposase
MTSSERMLRVMWRPAAALSLKTRQRADLEALVRSGKTPQRVAARAMIVLAAASGHAINAIAKEFHVSRPTVYLWCDRFRQAGVLGLLKDAPRPGRRTALTPEQIQAIVDATLHTTPPDATHWSVRTMAKTQGVSHAIVHRIWTAHGLQPHRVETFKLSRDREFIPKLRDVVGVYLHPPDKALVFCVDEKPQVQALDRTEPMLPLRPGIPARQTHDYVRHGTTNLFAALNILDGTVLARCAPRKHHIEFLAFLDQLDRSVPKRREIHLILDNYGTHTHPNVEAWFAAHSRYHRHFVPTSASWLNLVERWFAEITRKRIRGGTFRSLPDLIRAIEDYVTHHNRHAEPFIWTAAAARVLKKVRHCKEALETTH